MRAADRYGSDHWCWAAEVTRCRRRRPGRGSAAVELFMGLVVTNGSADPARPIVHLPAAMPGPDHITLLTPLAEPRPAACALSPGAVETQTEVPHRGILVMEWN